MTKEVILKKYKVNSLDEVPDKEILELALSGSLEIAPALLQQ